MIETCMSLKYNNCVIAGHCESYSRGLTAPYLITQTPWSSTYTLTYSQLGTRSHPAANYKETDRHPHLSLDGCLTVWMAGCFRESLRLMNQRFSL